MRHLSSKRIHMFVLFISISSQLLSISVALAKYNCTHSPFSLFLSLPFSVRYFVCWLLWIHYNYLYSLWKFLSFAERFVSICRFWVRQRSWMCAYDGYHLFQQLAESLNIPTQMYSKIVILQLVVVKCIILFDFVLFYILHISILRYFKYPYKSIVCVPLNA